MGYVDRRINSICGFYGILKVDHKNAVNHHTAANIAILFDSLHNGAYGGRYNFLQKNSASSPSIAMPLFTQHPPRKRKGIS